MTSLSDLADAVAHAMTTLGREPFAFFGHSMGAHLAFEVARRLRERGEPMPTRLFVSGARAPHLPRRERVWHNLSDDALIAELHTLGGTPQEVLRDRELLALILPIFRADLTALETHRHEVQAPLDLPLSAFGGLDDHAVSRADLDAWSMHSTRSMTTRMFPGAHFFIESARAAVLTQLYGALAQSPLAQSLGMQTRTEGMP
jgi:medium-chain acyl-[acyl-carrier-protein] hydrolase